MLEAIDEVRPEVMVSGLKEERGTLNPKSGSSMIAYRGRIVGFGDDEHRNARGDGSPGG